MIGEMFLNFIARHKRNYQLHLIILLPVVYIIIFRYIPMYGSQIAFRNFMASKGIWGSAWVGLENFIKFFNSYEFLNVIKNTLGINVYSLIAGFPIPIILALSINMVDSTAFKKTVQMLTYAPYFISTVVLVGMIIQFMSPNVGIYGIICRAIGADPANLMGEPAYFKSIYVWSGIWQGAGWGSIIYISVLSSIDPSLYDAATMDGATKFQRMRYIDFPGLLPTAIIILIVSAGSIMDVGFEKIFLMQNDLNLSASEVIQTYVYKVGISSSIPDYSYSTAIGLFNSIVNLVLIIAVNEIAKKNR